jgi:hypothetical protein
MAIELIEIALHCLPDMKGQRRGVAILWKIDDLGRGIRGGLGWAAHAASPYELL